MTHCQHQLVLLLLLQGLDSWFMPCFCRRLLVLLQRPYVSDDMKEDTRNFVLELSMDQGVEQV